MEKGKFRDLIALASVPLMMTLGNSMLVPVLPTIEKETGISSLQSSMIISVYSIVSIFFIPVAGYLSDRLGRKKIIVPGLAIAGIGGFISFIVSWLLETPFYFILAGRFIQGLGSAGAFPVVIPTIGDMFSKESDISRGLGIIETSNTAGKLLSPVLGALLAAVLWFIPFLFIPVFSFISIILVLIYVNIPKTPDDENRKSFIDFFNNIRLILKQKGKWLYTVFFVGFVSMFIYFNFLFYLSSTLEDTFNIHSISRGLLIAVPLLGLCATSFVIGKIIGRNMKLMRIFIISGFIIASSGLFALIPVESLISLIIFISIAAVGIGAVLPAADSLITEGIEKEHRGTITSLYSSARMLGVAAGPPTAAILMKADSAIFYVPAVTALLCILVTIVFIIPDKIKNPINELEAI
jgi:MFS transporter, ACDE family, multidrug resistance protein